MKRLLILIALALLACAACSTQVACIDLSCSDRGGGGHHPRPHHRATAPDEIPVKDGEPIHAPLPVPETEKPQ